MSGTSTSSGKNDYEKKYLSMKNSLITMTLVGLINHQRMLVETDSFSGWDIGYAIIESLEQYIKNNQSGWCKYIRNEQEHYHHVMSKAMQEIRKHFIPFV